MSPFADFLFFGVMLYILLPTIALGLWGKSNARWAFIAMLVALCVVYGNFFGEELVVRPKTETHGAIVVQFLAILLGYAAYQLIVTMCFFRWRSKPFFYVAVGLSILPLAVSKFIPLIPDTAFGFLGISYVTFRALDVIFSINDKVLTTFSPTQYLAFVFFFPTISSGPVDRYRRFAADWNRLRGRSEFLDDLDEAIARVFQGFLYKFIIAALLDKYWFGPAAKQLGFLGTANYMYAYTFYLFFDFAGYTAFAIGFSRLFGVKSPENFDKPFLSRNIRDFWNRWHISLSFWFRDHVYMRFLLAAGKGKWFKGKHTASYVGLFLTFMLMGIWHGPERYYLIYGAYHATLLCSYDAFARWNKKAKWWPDGKAMRVLNIVLTFHAIAFGLLIFSGRLSSHPVPRHEEVAEVVDCHVISGFLWDAKIPDGSLDYKLYIDGADLGTFTANELRPDLKEKGYGNGQHGFTFAVPDYFRDGRPHRVEAAVVGSGRTLKNTPEVFSCPAK